MTLKKRSQKASPPDAQKRDRSAVTKSELEAFTTHARWLIDYHDKRGDSLTTRATALLGFTGVILVLLLRGPIPKGIDVSLWITIAAISTIVCLLACALCCLLTILPGPSTAPGVDEVRTKWIEWLGGDGRGKILGYVTDSYLMAHDTVSKDFPVGAAYARADKRANRFVAAAAAMLAALVCLSALLCLMYQQLAHQ
ncbi:hypothetical protein [Nocardioides sp. WS12]|uniref:hypothetical protein n=1 Tax=Nocardioides sp. WS12 TaxID=2486272 RepID=UPI0015F7F02D|nr:hypothetical protein [Nocardioides sp. WS12]